MKSFLTIDEIMVDLRSRTRWDLKFIEEYQAFNNKNHEFENIFAKFSYKPHLDEIVANVDDWNTFKNFIADDFNNLKYPPCHLYIDRGEVTAFWFIPDPLLVYEISIEEEHLIMENIKKQLTELNNCDLEEITASGGDREIHEDLYLEYYREKQFLDALLPKNIKRPKEVCAKEEV
ncbi:hypothetical protein BSP4_43470 [Bacillus subtilis subsp. subtilis]|uniref:hypothetical protein n=1 Tax=Bacillus subtilis TaxID=1423 RepID=UPI000C7865FD|nr:hypothetical protein [Bacillus subtilis]PLV31808.1 hypothetical protein BSP4_43470 [Bacillus subtilis subsp. subtilis]